MISDTVLIDPEIVSGAPIFKNTRVPIQSLFDYLATCESLETYLEDYPSVQKDQIYAVLDLSGKIFIQLAGTYLNENSVR
jgi:uncharacterized protein (DUF433 family)